MLELMRKHMNWMMWTILTLIIVTFLFFGVYPSATTGGAAAEVYGEVVTASELNRVARNMQETYRQIFKDQFNEALASRLRGQALQELVQNRLLVREAERAGLRVSDAELQGHIMKIPVFSEGGVFKAATYQRYLDYINQKPAVFEEEQRSYLLRQKFERMIEGGVDVTEAEVAAAYAERNPKAKAGEFGKNRETFRQSLLTDKKRNAVNALVEGLYRQGIASGKIKIYEKLAAQ